ncbi:MATE family efflux transporter [Microvirga lotononidis]|uniref:Putative efflux protein, MATE family n=1 Tax=Microvirga lotononidis TaxID=864069 RepID=I4YXP8_9HYPH|nr:MATE family efflux transporter [Microvirga lotononidis]EIM28740.1 putative efflux protein, MATE family [Microvirga lotononidis]WQO25524.1 MATE family efflux transporter [Microvirga lotononidis]
MDGSTNPRRLDISHRRILLLALPMTLSHVTTPLLGLVDATVIGRLGEAHLLGAVALGAVIFDFVFWSFGSLRMATAGLTAQATGAGNRHEVDLTLARAFLVAGVTGVLLILLQWPIATLAFSMAGASPAVTEALSTYFFIRIWAAPFTLANYVILGSTLGRGRTDLGLLLQVAINVANIVFTMALVLGFGLGIAGAAIGTALAEVVGVGLGIVVLRRLGSNPLAVTRHEVLNRTAMVQTLAMNRDIMIRNVALILAFSIFSALGARSGDVTLAANAVLYNMFLIGGYFLDGFATAAETLCGQCIGARDERGFRRAIRLSLGWCIGFGFAVSSLFLIGGGVFIDFVSTNPDVRAYAREYLVFAALTPFFGAAAFAFDGIYTGATWTRSMRDLMVIALIAYGAILLVAHDLGNTALWIALLTFLSARGLGQFILYPRLAKKTFASMS